MTIRLSTSLAAIVGAEATKYSQVRVLESALTTNRRIKAKQVANVATAQEDVWTSGILFRDAALIGAFTYFGKEITKYGVTSDMQTCLAVDLTTGKSVIRIEGNGHWIEGTLGLIGSGADFIVPANPTTTNSLAISGTFRIRANQLLSDGTPDLNPPTVTLASSVSNVTAPGPIVLTATANDDVGVTRIEFYRNGELILNKTEAPWMLTESVNYTQNGQNVYAAKAFDASNKSTTSTNVNIAINIPAPPETGPATAVGSVFTDITFENTTAIVQANVKETFGQLFKIGALPVNNAAVELRAPDNSIVSCQLNVKATHQDGSVKHAIISTIIPTLMANASVKYDILRKASPLTGVNVVPSDFAGMNATVTLVDYGTEVDGPSVGTTYIADALTQLANGNYETWFTGPIAGDWVVSAPLKTLGGVEHPHLHARFVFRGFKGHAYSKVDVVIENTWARVKDVLVANQIVWQNVSNVPCIYSYEVKLGDTVVDTRSVKGFVRTRAPHAASGVYDPYSTGLSNDSAVYTATVVIDGVVKNLSVIGSNGNTYGKLIPAINAQLGGLATCAGDFTMSGLKITSATTGANSSVVITDYGTLFPAQCNTGLSGSVGTPGNYTAQITINGNIVKDIAFTRTTGAMGYGEFCAVLNAQLTPDATCRPIMGAPGIAFQSTATGLASDVVITNNGNIFGTTNTKFITPYRPMKGNEFLHYPSTRWKKSFYPNGSVAHIKHNKAYLMATKGVPNYQADLVGDSAKIDYDWSIMDAADIGNHGITKAGMGGTGYAPGIGILPEWAVMWLVSQNLNAKKTMLKMGDLQGSFPCHHRDYATDRPIDFQQWPYATNAYNNADSLNSSTGFQERLPALTIPTQIPVNVNAPDVAHHPDFGLLPYIATGDHYYMETLLMYNRYNTLTQNPASVYRQSKKSLWIVNQTRGCAWAMRTAVHAHYITPDNHPLKTDLTYAIDQNILWFNANIVDPAGPEHSFFGHIGDMIYARAGFTENALAPWQEDFATSVAGRAVELGYTQFQPYLNYKSKFVAGRLTSGEDFCWQWATNYTLRFKDAKNTPEYTSWAEVYDKTFLQATIQNAQCGTQSMADAISSVDGRLTLINGMSGYPDLFSGYPANLQPAVAYCASFNAPGGQDSWLVFDNRSMKPNYNLGPQWAIVPRV